MALLEQADAGADQQRIERADLDRPPDRGGRHGAEATEDDGR
jgi:hypothetical protein